TIGRYIDQVNILYGKQVALRVNVYSLELRQEQSVGFDLSTILPSLDLGATKIAAQLGAITTPTGSLGSATATILNGQLKNSQAILTALQKVGRAKQITSAGIVCLNNQPAPVEAIKKIAYLAGSSVESTDSGTETELTPGEVTTGFSMTITPHILSNRQVVLQYSVHLSNLDSLEAIESNNTKIQLPHVSTRAFAQKASMLMGQTLVLAGFEQATRQEQKKFGLLSLSKNQDLTKSLIIITIEVENADTWA
ncbi:MAG: pilus assembly protein, partial [Desulfovibrio sp.]|nr:pilus assembly protein [Desulfovibrio sp.]